MFLAGDNSKIVLAHHEDGKKNGTEDLYTIRTHFKGKEEPAWRSFSLGSH